MIGCLGIDLASYYQYPETAILKKVSYFKFIERVEGILSINWLLDVMMVLSFILFSLNKGINTFVKGKKHTILYILCLIILLLTGIKFTIALDKLLLPLSLIFILLPLLLYLQILCTKKEKTILNRFFVLINITVPLFLKSSSKYLS